MNDLTYDDLPRLKISTRLIVKELLDRGLRVRGFASTGALLQIHLPDNKVPMRLYSVIDESMSFVAGRSIASNKEVTNAIIKDMGIRVPDELYMTLDALHNNEEKVSEFIAKHGRVVAKPVDGAHGKAVYTNLASYGAVMQHAESIIEGSRFSGFLIQQQLKGLDVRVVCINGKYASAMTRVPATVVGDGEHTVAQLIEQENLQQNRSGDNYGTLFNKINMDYVRHHLSVDELATIPALAEERQVIGISNVGVGGTRKNIDDDLPAYMIEQAEAISHELRLPVCGVDFFVDKLPQPDTPENELNPVIIEVNNCPGVTMYESFDDPRQAEIIRKLIDAQIAAHQRLYPSE